MLESRREIPCVQRVFDKSVVGINYVFSSFKEITDFANATTVEINVTYLDTTRFLRDVLDALCLQKLTF